MRARSLVLACAVASCQSPGGAVQLQLQLPTDDALRPAGMTTIAVIATGADGTPTETTSVIADDGTFTAGDVPVGTGVGIDVLLRDETGRLVGVGEAPKPVDISGTATESVDIPVRRPFVYVSTPTTLVSFDPTIDARGDAFQGSIDGISAPKFVVSAGGDRLGIVSATSVQAVDTSSNELVGKPIDLPGTAADATAVPGTHQIAVAYDHGIAIVDLDSGDVEMTEGGTAIDRVTVGADASGVMTAYGLVGRVAAPISPFDTCATTTSTLVSVPVGSPGTFATVPLATGLSDIAADPSASLLFGTAPCDEQVDLIDPTGTVTSLAPLARAAALSVLNGRVWAAGSHPSVPVCFSATSSDNTPVDCTTQSDHACPPGTRADTFVDHVGSGASLILESIATQSTGGADDTVSFDVPGRRETIVNTNDTSEQTAEVLKAYQLEVVDMVALPGGQFVSVVVNSSYFKEQAGEQDPFSGETVIVLPCQLAQTSDWLLMDMANLTVFDRVRTRCDLMTGSSDDIFTKWKCDDTTPQETSSVSAYTPISVGALFGAR